MMNYLKIFLPYLFGNKKGKSLDVPLPSPIPWADLSFEEILMFHSLQKTINDYVHAIDLSTLSKKDIFHLFNFLEHLNADLNKKITDQFTIDADIFHQAKNSNLKTIEFQQLLDFKNQRLSVFAILKTDRNIPGLLIIRAPDGQFVKDQSGNIWSIPILGLSTRGLPFSHSNGCTPCGVMSIDSVMPNSDKNYDFGEFRRLIVNFIKISQDESELKKLIPASHHHLNWWLPSVVARELGRSLLRIHGTGRTNSYPLTPYYPFVPTSGCLATNESSLFGNKAQDQRLLLDQLMAALNLPLSDANESKIHGLLYVVDFDGNLTSVKF